MPHMLVFFQPGEYLSRDLPYNLAPDDVYLTVGAKQAIDIILPVFARPGANILLPKPGYPGYQAHATLSHLEIRHFDLLPEKGWEVDLEGLKSLANDKTVAMVIVNPCNPCGNVFTYEHLQKVAETASKLGILVIADEVYGHLAFGNTQFVPMGVFASTVPVITIGSISERWTVPGWRLGWIVTSDPNGILHKNGIVDSLKGSLGVTSGPATFIQSKERVNCAAMPPARSFYRLHWDGEDLYPNLNTPNRSTKKKSNWYHF